MNLRSLISDLMQDKQKLAWTLFWVFIGYFLLRSCIANSLNSLPNEVTNKIQKQFVVCIKPEDTPIWPGEPRQPECGSVDTKVLGIGIVPDAQKANGVTDAICYQATYQNPYWSTLGTTRHELNWTARTAYKVTILQNGSWEVFPDEDQEDLARWATYSCPAQK